MSDFIRKSEQVILEPGHEYYIEGWIRVDSDGLIYATAELELIDRAADISELETPDE